MIDELIPCRTMILARPSRSAAGERDGRRDFPLASSSGPRSLSSNRACSFECAAHAHGDLGLGGLGERHSSPQPSATCPRAGRRRPGVRSPSATRTERSACATLVNGVATFRASSLAAGTIHRHGLVRRHRELRREHHGHDRDRSPATVPAVTRATTGPRPPPS